MRSKQTIENEIMSSVFDRELVSIIFCKNKKKMQLWACDPSIKCVCICVYGRLYTIWRPYLQNVIHIVVATKVNSCPQWMCNRTSSPDTKLLYIHLTHCIRYIFCVHFGFIFISFVNISKRCRLSKKKLI